MCGMDDGELIVKTSNDCWVVTVQYRVQYTVQYWVQYNAVCCRMCGIDDGELIVKTSSDCWVVGKRCDKREVYVVISHKNANLIEINGRPVLDY